MCGSWAGGDREVELSLKRGAFAAAKNAETGAAIPVSGGRVRFRLAKHDLALLEFAELFAVAAHAAEQFLRRLP